MIRGQTTLTLKHIIGLIVLIISGVTLIFVWFIFSDSISANTETCKLSILSRATLPAGASYIPLKCSTNKFCLVESKSDTCSSFAGEKDFDKIKIEGKNDLEKAEFISKISTENFYDCWSMTGKGKVDIFATFTGKTGLDPAVPTCIICSRIAIGDKVSQEILKKVDVPAYMKDTLVPGSQETFLQALTDKSIRNYASYKQDTFERTFDETIKKSGDEISIGNGRELAVVFTQIKTTSFGDAITNLGTATAIGAGSTYFIPFVGKKILSYLLFTKVGLAISFVAGGVVAGVAYVNTFEGQNTAIAYCGQFSSSNKDNFKGCSTVQFVPYKAGNINVLCKQLEGSP